VQVFSGKPRHGFLESLLLLFDPVCIDSAVALGAKKATPPLATFGEICEIVSPSQPRNRCPSRKSYPRVAMMQPEQELVW
jgi:hypothetical protein